MEKREQKEKKLTNETTANSKENHQQSKTQPTEWENIFTDTSDKGLITKIYKVLTK